MDPATGRVPGNLTAIDVSCRMNLKYLYDGENVIYELWDDKTVCYTHPVKSNSCASGCGAANCDLFFTDHPISISIDGVKYFYLYDGLGSVTELIDASENVVNSYRYTPFGEALIRDETVYNPHQFTGRQYDAESGKYHYRARSYDANLGRFMQQDPAGMIDGANMYAYVGNNPVNGVDPSGMLPGIGPPMLSICTSVFSQFGAKWLHDPDLSGYYQWRLHAAVGCEMARAGCDFSTTLAIFKMFESGESAPRDIFGINYLPSWLPIIGGSTPSYSQNDIHASMWGWHFSTWSPGISCKDMAISKFSRMGSEENAVRFDISTYPPHTLYSPPTYDYIPHSNSGYRINPKELSSGWWSL